MADVVPGLVTIVALLLYLYMGLEVGRARTKYGIPAPAQTGNPDFERVVRVQMNTLEWLPLFLVPLWLFAAHVDPLIAGALGVVWILGRILYMRGYTAAANQRSSGFMIQAMACLALVVGAVLGLLWRAFGIAPLF